MEFPITHIHAPQSTHNHTVILLHGRGSKGPEFAEEFFASLTSKNKNLAACLPTWRWVFPTSRDRWTTAFQEEMCTWFDAYSLSNIQERQELQVEGLRESVSHILDILENEIRLLNGKANHVYLGGISQGMATALWTIFCALGRVNKRLGGVLGFCGWLPFANQAEELIQQVKNTNKPDVAAERLEIQRLVSDFFLKTIGAAEILQRTGSVDEVSLILTTPVLFCHGTDDVWVSIELGKQVFLILQEVMGNVEWKEYSGAEEEGHWIKEPEGFDYILQFLETTSNEA